MNNELTITLSTQQWDVIVNALAQRPYGEVVGLLTEIQNQAQQEPIVVEKSVED